MDYCEHAYESGLVCAPIGAYKIKKNICSDAIMTSLKFKTEITRKPYCSHPIGSVHLTL